MPPLPLLSHPAVSSARKFILSSHVYVSMAWPQKSHSQAQGTEQQLPQEPSSCAVNWKKVLGRIRTNGFSFSLSEYLSWYSSVLYFFPLNTADNWRTICQRRPFPLFPSFSHKPMPAAWSLLLLKSIGVHLVKEGTLRHPLDGDSHC